MHAAQAGNRHCANHCGASARQRRWCFSNVGTDSYRTERIVAFRDIATDLLCKREERHGGVCKPDVAAVDSLPRRIPDHCASCPADCGDAGADQRAPKRLRRPNRMGPRDIVPKTLCITLADLWCADRDDSQGVFLQPIAPLLERKTTKTVCLSPRSHRPQGVMQRVSRACRHCGSLFRRCGLHPHTQQRPEKPKVCYTETPTTVRSVPHREHLPCCNCGDHASREARH